MKRLVLTNDIGDILATGPHPGDCPQGNGLPTGFGFVPLSGQHLHVVQFPDHIRTMDDLEEIHRTYKVIKRNGQSRLECH
jgi:hypothetical protein